MNIGVSDIETDFNTIDIEIQYEPEKVEFNMVQGEDGAYELATQTITDVGENLQVIGTAILPNTGIVRVILLVTGEDSTIAETATLFTLNGKAKSGLANGSTNIDITKFEVAAEGELGNVNIEDATHQITIEAASIISNPSDGNSSSSNADSLYTGLQKAITSAITDVEHAVEGVKVGQYKVGAIAKLEQAINDAKNNGDVVSALSSLKTAIAAFNSERITLAGNGTITIADLSILIKYYGVTSNDALWSEIAKADVLNANVINIHTLAAIAQMITSNN